MCVQNSFGDQTCGQEGCTQTTTMMQDANDNKDGQWHLYSLEFMPNEPIYKCRISSKYDLPPIMAPPLFRAAKCDFTDCDLFVFMCSFRICVYV